MARTCIANKFDLQTPIPPGSPKLDTAFLHSIANYIVQRIAYHVGGAADTANVQEKLVAEISLLTRVGTVNDDPDIAAMWGLFKAEPSGSPFSLQALLDAIKIEIEDDDPASKHQFSRRYYANFRAVDYRFMSARRFFLVNGGLLAVGPEDTSLDDEVWVVAGCYTPVMMRWKGSGPADSGETSHELLGPAYVHGVMYVEALDMGFEWENIVLG